MRTERGVLVFLSCLSTILCFDEYPSLAKNGLLPHKGSYHANEPAGVVSGIVSGS